MSMSSPNIKSLVEMVAGNELVLPAMQRPFVWQEERILRLMDSLLRQFPLGALLVWETDESQRYRPFTKDAVSGEQPLVNFPEAGAGRRLKYVLDGQQRLTSLYIALRGSLDGRRLYLDLLSGDPADKDPGEMYYDLRFLGGAEAAKLNAERAADGSPARHFVLFQDVIRVDPAELTERAMGMSQELKLQPDRAQRLSRTLGRAGWQVRSERPLQVIVIDEFGQTKTPIDEILEIFVRVNSGGLVLQKSDLLMSLLDLSWNDVQPELLRISHAVTQNSPVGVTRDMILKTALLQINEDSRFDKLVRDRDHIRAMAPALQAAVPLIEKGWAKLAVVLKMGCKIHSPRFFRNATNALLPFAIWFANNPTPSPAEERRVVAGIYLALMSTVFGGAEARMGSFARDYCRAKGAFPLERLARLARDHRGVTSVHQLLSYHLDLALNIAQGGVVLDGNPDELERDHIFPKATLEKQKVADNLINHYANFHFLRGTDNRNKTDKAPHLWFAQPGDKAPPYTDQDLADRLIERDLIEPGAFAQLIERRGAAIRTRALALFHLDETAFNALFVG